MPAKVVVLTFGDSCACHAAFVAPVLKRIGSNAALFAAEGFNFHTDKSSLYDLGCAGKI